MTDKNRSKPDAIPDSRRQSFKKILGVGGVMAGSGFAAGQWTKPVVNAVLLPAHAQTSGVSSLTDPCSITVVCTGRYDFQVTVNGVVVPATPDVAVALTIEFGYGLGSFGSPEPFDSVTTDANGEYAATDTYSYDSATVAEIRVTATLPDFPEAGDAVCTVLGSDDGPHSLYSFSYSPPYYFCNQYPVEE